MTPATLLPADPWWRRPALLVACSGGLDSTALLDLLVEHRRRCGWPERLGAACFDHGWRGREGAADAELVAELCARLDVPFFAGRAADTPPARRLSPETRARRGRYRFLAEVARREGFDAVATAHHAVDQGETVLLRLQRGGRAEGLAGIQPTAPIAGVEVVRPLLDVDPAALVAHAERRSLPFREDATNADARFPRNRLRALGLARRGADDLQRIARFHALRRRLIEAGARRVEPTSTTFGCDGVRLGSRFLRRLAPSLRRELLRRAYRRVPGARPALPERALDQLERALGSPTAARVDLPRVTARFSCDVLLLTAADDGLPPPAPQGALVESFAVDDLDGALEVRPWRAGDRLDLPRGGRKKVKDVFREARVPAWQRAAWPVVADAAGVLWIPGLRRGGRAAPVPGRAARRVRLAAARGACGRVDWSWRVEGV